MRPAHTRSSHCTCTYQRIQFCIVCRSHGACVRDVKIFGCPFCIRTIRSLFDYRSIRGLRESYTISLYCRSSPTPSISTQDRIQWHAASSYASRSCNPFPLPCVCPPSQFSTIAAESDRFEDVRNTNHFTVHSPETPTAPSWTYRQLAL